MRNTFSLNLTSTPSRGIYKAGSVKAFTHSLHNNLKRTARDVLVTPLDNEHVIAPFMNDVTDVVLITTDVLDSNLLTRQVWAKYTNHQHVVPCKIIIRNTNYIKAAMQVINISFQAGRTEQHPHVTAISGRAREQTWP